MFVRLKVILIIMAIVTVIAATTLIASVYFMRSGLREATENYIAVIAEISEKLVSTEINLLRANAAAVAQRLVNEPFEEWGGILREQLAVHENFLAFTVADRGGPLLSEGGAPTPADLLGSEYARRAFAGETTISTTRKDPTGELVFHVCAPLGEEEGRILSATIPGLLFCDLLDDFQIWKTGTVYILDSDGTVLANQRRFLALERYNSIEAAKTDPEARSSADFTSLAIRGGRGVGRYSLFGVERQAAYIPISGSNTNWILGVSSPISESPDANVTEGLFLTSLIFLGLGTLAAFLASGFIAKPFLVIQRQNLHLAEMSAATQQASQAKSRFLANMSHEMRTPLSAIVGFSELLIHSPPPPGELARKLEQIHGAGMTLLGIVNDILDISKIESGRFELIPAEYDLASLVNDAITLNIIRIGEKPIRFELKIEETLPARLLGDELRVKQIMNNLLSNAFKYTREGRVELELAAERDGEDVWLAIVVRDTGIGIREEDLAKLFADYSQLDARSNRRIEGTGLGLSISQRLAEMMGGGIRAESEFGKGSVFTARVRQRFVSDGRLGAEAAENLRKFQYFRQNRAWISDLSIHPLPHARVLLVDDVPANLEIGRGMLKPYGMRVDTVSNGRKAVDLVREGKNRYQAIFMDHMMPEMDGVEAVRLIREIGTEYAETVPIIALTANAITGNKEMFLEHGFQDFLSKPIDPAQLNRVLRNWVRNRELEGDEAKPPPEELPASAREIGPIDGFDREAALARFGGDREAFLRALRSYAENTPPLIAQARPPDDREGLAAYAIVVHGIKSSSYGVGVGRLGGLAEDLELAAKSGDLEFVRANHAALPAAAEKFLGELAGRLAELDGEGGRTECGEPDPAVLDRLRRACENYDMDGADQAMAELEGFAYGREGELISWLRERIAAMDFRLIAEKLSARSAGRRPGG
ncbi:MAG: response regulator [Planctomycetota bacterium]|jgi:signal transduction histidine kinase/CheY-like chemotaxis protein/HPt (histidine-containing phosphotransfer) domain-containing protein|nr:response regulator [Planctomycetota bacterium]